MSHFGWGNDFYMLLFKVFANSKNAVVHFFKIFSLLL